MSHCEVLVSFPDVDHTQVVMETVIRVTYVAHNVWNWFCVSVCFVFCLSTILESKEELCKLFFWYKLDHIVEKIK